MIGQASAQQPRQLVWAMAGDSFRAPDTSAGKLLSEMVGSSFYIAPEVLRGKYSAKADIWSAGVIVYIMLSGLPPFWGPNTRECFNNILTAAPSLEGDLWDSVSELGKNFIRGCDPTEQAHLCGAFSAHPGWGLP